MSRRYPNRCFPLLFVATLIMMMQWTVVKCFRASTLKAIFAKQSRLMPARYLTPSLYARKKKNVDDEAAVAADATKPGWVTVSFGKEEDVRNAEMDERLKDAERWVSKQLTDDEADILNRAMGIEKDILAALEDEENENEKGKSSSSKKTSLKNSGKKGDKRDVKSIIGSIDQEAARVKGFLELNPYICSGCGAPFQSKSMETPGFLPKDKLQDHLKNAGRIREKQEAIKILELAGIEVDSPAAEEILRDANISGDVIAGVRALGRGQTAQYDAENSLRQHGLATEDGDDDEDYYMGRFDDEEYDGDDALDGLEIGLEDLIGDDGEGSVIKALKKSIEQASSTAAGKNQNQSADVRTIDLSGGVPRSAILINDIDDEVRGKGRAKVIAAEASLDEDKYANFPSSKSRAKHASSSTGSSSSNRLQLPKLSPDGLQIVAESQKDKKSKSGTVASFEDNSDSICICQRCFRLQQYGQVEQSLRPGWSEHELLTPQRFESLLGEIKETESVVLCIVDVFDLQGSLLANLKEIAGPNPIVIAANKVDLLPNDISEIRLTNWIHSEVKRYCDLISPRDVDEEKRYERMSYGWNKEKKEEEYGVLRRSNVHLVSCQSGTGMDQLMGSLIGLAQDNGQKVYVMGAANVGKSSFINRLLDTSYQHTAPGKRKAEKAPHATVSNLPGTTLNFLKIKLPNGVTMIDTPGLINLGQLTSRLSTEELRQVIPAKPINAVTLRLVEGKTVLVGGLARIEHVEGRPFFFTFFVSNEVKLHPTDSTKVDAFLEKHVGGLVAPPATLERLQELGPFEDHIFQLEGDSWRSASNDIVIAGLGWVSVTGPGMCKIKVTVPKGTTVTVRPPLLPFEAKETTAKFTGGKILKRSRKTGPAAGKAYGWRA